MKILLVGRYDSALNQEFSEKLISSGHLIDLLDITNNSFFCLNFKRKYKYFELPRIFNKILPLVFFYRISKCKKYLGNITNDYDLIIYLYIKYEYLFLYKLINKKSKQIIATVWGSDFWKNPIKFMFKKFYLNTDLVTVNNEQLKDDLIKYFYKQLKDKTIVCRFGIKSLDYINDIAKNENKIECKRKLGLSEDSLIITIGSRADSLEQHIKVIDEIKLLDKIRNIQFVFPLTYGNKSYKEKLIKYIKLNFDKGNSIIFDKFLSYEDIARLRLASDIFINLRETDQFSSAMLQHLYAGSIVINGAWLPYKELYDRHAFCFKIKTISEINQTINEIIKNKDNYKDILMKNKEIIYQMWHWEYNIKKWNQEMENLKLEKGRYKFIINNLNKTID